MRKQLLFSSLKSSICLAVAYYWYPNSCKYLFSSILLLPKQLQILVYYHTIDTQTAANTCLVPYYCYPNSCKYLFNFRLLITPRWQKNLSFRIWFCAFLTTMSRMTRTLYGQSYSTSWWSIFRIIWPNRGKTLLILYLPSESVISVDSFAGRSASSSFLPVKSWKLFAYMI